MTLRRKKKLKSGRVTRTKRRGKPFTIYFSEEQARLIDSVCKQRRIPKASLVRFALERLLNQLSNGQLELPLGM